MDGPLKKIIYGLYEFMLCGVSLDAIMGVAASNSGVQTLMSGRLGNELHPGAGGVWRKACFLGGWDKGPLGSRPIGLCG